MRDRNLKNRVMLKTIHIEYIQVNKFKQLSNCKFWGFPLQLASKINLIWRYQEEKDGEKLFEIFKVRKQ